MSTLEELIQETESKIKHEKDDETKRKLRWIFDDIKVWERKKKQSERDVEKWDKAITKAEDKIVQLRNGNHQVLDGINPDKQHGKEENPQKQAEQAT